MCEAVATYIQLLEALFITYLATVHYSFNKKRILKLLFYLNNVIKIWRCQFFEKGWSQHFWITDILLLMLISSACEDMHDTWLLSYFSLAVMLECNLTVAK